MSEIGLSVMAENPELLCLPFSAMNPPSQRGTAAPIGVPQNNAVRQITSEIRFDDIAGCELLAASLRIEATFSLALSARR